MRVGKEVHGRAYYNEIDPFCAQWLRNLIAAGHIADGDVDERSIEDVRPDDVRGYTQCHYFAGIGVWSYALRLAGWPDDRPVWTGSCPCQPFSSAGARNGFADERHLWPAWFHLIRQCRPRIVFGEQVASLDGLGWLDLVQADLEGSKYTSAAIDLCAAGVGAPHIRQRIWFVAYPEGLHGPERLDVHGRQQGEIQQSNGGSVPKIWMEAPSPIACMADGFAEGVESVRALGNAIVPQVASTFVRAYLEIEEQPK